MIPLKQILLICAVVVLVGCGQPAVTREEAEKEEAELKAILDSLEAVPVVTVTIDNPILERAIRRKLEKPEGELTKADYEKVKGLDLDANQLTSVKGLEKLTQLTYLDLDDNPDPTKAQIDELQKEVPKCYIDRNPKK